jgi:hypothetical protein
MVINANGNSFTHLCCRQWEDTTFEGTSHKRHVNIALGKLVHLHNAGKIPRSDGASSIATYWVDYSISPNVIYGTTQG